MLDRILSAVSIDRYDRLVNGVVYVMKLARINLVARDAVALAGFYMNVF